MSRDEEMRSVGEELLGVNAPGSTRAEAQVDRTDEDRLIDNYNRSDGSANDEATVDSSDRSNSTHNQQAQRQAIEAALVAGQLPRNDLADLERTLNLTLFNYYLLHPATNRERETAEPCNHQRSALGQDRALPLLLQQEVRNHPALFPNFDGEPLDRDRMASLIDNVVQMVDEDLQETHHTGDAET